MTPDKMTRHKMTNMTQDDKHVLSSLSSVVLCRLSHLVFVVSSLSSRFCRLCCFVSGDLAFVVLSLSSLLSHLCCLYHHVFVVHVITSLSSHLCHLFFVVLALLSLLYCLSHLVFVVLVIMSLLCRLVSSHVIQCHCCLLSLSYVVVSLASSCVAVSS